MQNARKERLAELHGRALLTARDYVLLKGYVPQILYDIIKASASYDAFLKYNPDQPRVPAGNGRESGEWTSGGDGGNGNDHTAPTHMVQEIPPVFDPDIGPEGPIEPLPGMPGGPPLPANPSDLLEQGYHETTHPNAGAAGNRTFENPDTGDTLRFDQGKPDEPRFGGQDHYHRYNPNSTGDRDLYLDRNGNPVPRNSKPSHLLPGETA